MEQQNQPQVQWQRDRVQELCSKGYSQREVARVLQIGLATVNREILSASACFTSWHERTIGGSFGRGRIATSYRSTHSMHHPWGRHIQHNLLRLFSAEDLSPIQPPAGALAWYPGCPALVRPYRVFQCPRTQCIPILLCRHDQEQGNRIVEWHICA